MENLTLGTVVRVTGGRILRGHRTLQLTGISTNTHTLRNGELFFALHGRTHDAHRFLPQAAAAGAGAAVVHRDDLIALAPHLPVVRVPDTTRALGDLAHWHRSQCEGTTVIAVTGSNGKTTAKDMLYHILSGVVRSIRSHKSFNNHVGVPLTLFQMRPDDVYAVVELGTNSPGEIARLCEIADPEIGLLTNVSATHIEGLGSVRGVAREKAALVRHTCRRAGAFYNADDFWSREIAKATNGSLYSFGLDNQADVRAGLPVWDDQSISFKMMGDGPRLTLPIPGRHNMLNALGAIAVARKLGIDWGTIAERLASFKLPDMRMQRIELGEILLINDAYNACPASMEAAIDTLQRVRRPGRKILVLADMLELGGQAIDCHRKLGQLIANFDIDYLLGVGEHTAEVLDSAGRHGMSPHDLSLAQSKDQLAGTLLDLIGPGDTVLFKGSRSNKLEEVVDQVQNGLARPGLHGQPADHVYAQQNTGDTDANADGGPANTPVARQVG